MSDWDDDYPDGVYDENVESATGAEVLVYCMECGCDHLLVPGEPFECNACGWTEAGFY